METDGNRRQRAPIDLRSLGAGILLSAASGIAVNKLSNDVGYQAVIAAALVAAVITTTSWLRRRPRALIPRYTPRVLIVLSSAATALSLATYSAWASVPTAAAIGLVAAAVLIPASPAAAGRLLVGALVIASGLMGILGGVVLTWFGVGMWQDSGVLAVIVLGAAVAVTVPSGLLVVLGVAVISGRLALATRRTEGEPRIRDLLLFAAFLPPGVVFFGSATDWSPGHEFALRAGSVILGLAFLAAGFSLLGLLPRGDVLLGAAFVAGGSGFALFGVTYLGRADILLGTALLGLGAAIVTVGTGTLRAAGALRWMERLWERTMEER
jgi:hypothetical protein